MKAAPLFAFLFLFSFTTLDAYADSAAARKVRHGLCRAAHPIKKSGDKCIVICDRLDKPHLCDQAMGECKRKGLNILHGMSQAIQNVQDCLDPLVSQASRR